MIKFILGIKTGYYIALHRSICDNVYFSCSHYFSGRQKFNIYPYDDEAITSMPNPTSDESDKGKMLPRSQSSEVNNHTRSMASDYDEGHMSEIKPCNLSRSLDYDPNQGYNPESISFKAKAQQEVGAVPGVTRVIILCIT